MKLEPSYIYLLFALSVGLAAYLVIPKEQLKKFFIYGLILGGILDTIIVILFGKVFSFFQYKNMEVFNILDIYSFWTPITWTFVLMMFLYLLPSKKIFLYPYVLSFGFLNYSVGLVMQNFGLFEYIGWYKYVAPLTFIGWYSISVWAFCKSEKLKLK